MNNPNLLTVVGAGYVGLATAIGLASRGHEVELVELREDRLRALQNGSLPIHEVGMAAAFADPEVRARIHPVGVLTTEHPDLVLVCVGTPVAENGRSDLRQLEGALTACRPLAQSGVPIVIRSTLPAGSSEQIVRWSGGDRSRIFTNPEFLRQGTALEDFLRPTRVVIGTFPAPDPAALKLVEEILAAGDAPRLVVTVAEADLIKNGANAFLALKLSFANELAILCEELDADVLHVIDGIGLDPRIGRNHMEPSFGFGGSCLPKDLRSLTNVGRDLGIEMHVTSAASDANEASQRRFARRIFTALPTGCDRVALLGLAFKAGTDDVRLSPAMRVAELLIGRGVTVTAYDPFAAQNASAELPSLHLVPSAEAAVENAGVVVIATEWPEFRELDWAALGERMCSRTIIDGRRLLDPARMADLGFHYEAVGAPLPAHRRPGGAGGAGPHLHRTRH
jgi:UDPglucose 6-dehydrogenase